MPNFSERLIPQEEVSFIHRVDDSKKEEVKEQDSNLYHFRSSNFPDIPEYSLNYGDGDETMDVLTLATGNESFNWFEVINFKERHPINVSLHFTDVSLRDLEQLTTFLEGASSEHLFCKSNFNESRGNTFVNVDLFSDKAHFADEIETAFKVWQIVAHDKDMEDEVRGAFAALDINRIYPQDLEKKIDRVASSMMLCAQNVSKQDVTHMIDIHEFQHQLTKQTLIEIVDDKYGAAEEKLPEIEKNHFNHVLRQVGVLNEALSMFHELRNESILRESPVINDVTRAHFHSRLLSLLNSEVSELQCVSNTVFTVDGRFEDDVLGFLKSNDINDLTAEFHNCGFLLLLLGEEALNSGEDSLLQEGIYTDEQIKQVIDDAIDNPDKYIAQFTNTFYDKIHLALRTRVDEIKDILEEQSKITPIS